MKLLITAMIFAYMIMSGVMASHGEWGAVCLLVGLYTFCICVFGIIEAIEGLKK